MEQHFNSAELSAYARGKVSAAELLRMDDHIAACGKCRAALPAPLESLVFVDHELAPEHLTEDQLDAWAMGRPIAAEAVEHVDGCEECRGHAQDLRKFMADNPARPASGVRKSVWFMAVAAALAAAVGIGVMNRQPARSIPASVPPPEVIAKAEIPAALQQQLDAAIQSGELRLPAAIAAMPTAQLRLRSTAVKQPLFHVVSPLSTAVIADTPTFRWTEVPGAGFQVFVYDDQFTEVMHSEPVKGKEWTAHKPLARGKTYRWEVRATLGGQSASAPVPPDPDAVFQMMTADVAEGMAGARAALRDNPLGLGIIYANAGAVEEAREALSRSPDANAQKLLGKLPRALR